MDGKKDIERGLKKWEKWRNKKFFLKQKKFFKNLFFFEKLN